MLLAERILLEEVVNCLFSLTAAAALRYVPGISSHRDCIEIGAKAVSRGEGDVEHEIRSYGI